MVTFLPKPKFNQNAAAILFTKEHLNKKWLSPGNAEISKKIREIALSKHFSGETGQIFPFLNKKTLVVLIGLGSEKDLTTTQLRVQLRKALLSQPLTHLKTIEIIPHRHLGGCPRIAFLRIFVL